MNYQNTVKQLSAVRGSQFESRTALQKAVNLSATRISNCEQRFNFIQPNQTCVWSHPGIKATLCIKTILWKNIIDTLKQIDLRIKATCWLSQLWPLLIGLTVHVLKYHCKLYMYSPTSKFISKLILIIILKQTSLDKI